MLTAITRGISPCIGDCELTYLRRHPINVENATRQQQAYERLLSELDLRVISLPAEPELPDAVFVEDTAVVTDEVAVIPTMGVAARQREVESISELLSKYRPLKCINGAGTLEGGDVVRAAGRTLFVGVSKRTNMDGIIELRQILKPYDYRVMPVEVKGCLHLSTGGAFINRNTVLVNSEWVDVAPFAGYDIIDVSTTEPWGANALTFGDDVLIAASCPQTAARVRERGFRVHTVDISELEKAEGGLTCMSIIFAS
jgi:dimethylargininase